MFFVLLVLELLIPSLGQVPIPVRPLGFRIIGNGNPHVVLEVFYDHLCSSSASNWPILKKLIVHYDDKPVQITIHIFPLPYHHNSYFMQQAGETIKNNSELSFLSFIQHAFSYQTEFLSGAVELNELQVKNKIALFAESCCSVSSDIVLKGFDDPVIVSHSRTAWKYAAHRGITGTPQFIINGVHYPDGTDHMFDDWTKLIDNLLSAK